MTTRPGRQPRAVSFTNQRPPPLRTPSQQYSSSSPTRRSNEGFVDLTPEGGDAALARPRIGTSRLRVEISDSTHADLHESPKPVSGVNPTWRPSLPPHGRPHLHFDVPSISHPKVQSAQDGGHGETMIKPVPLPVRPGQYAPPNSEKQRQLPPNIVKKDVRPKPYTLEVPTAAPRYSPHGHADFYPWTGNHPEDQFSEPVIRQGYFDKAQMTQNETGSGRPSIFPALKHKSGLQTLSSLFTNVLAQRRAHGQISSGSTFKPPPRVTVTDTKREMWLRDLANPAISLRRLSRSIPHGIRGKVLLDQSLSKNIPIDRAVWLAKCVGANELRSFRRKTGSGTFAMGGEAKWIRDFTVCVEQFVESIVTACGENDFKARITYAIRLATHFHAEHLLDREHYMDWLVSSLESSPQAKLPMWLLTTQVYWVDLLRLRKYGRRLSAALLNQLAETLKHPDSDILAPLSDRLKILLKELMSSNPNGFFGPSTWKSHRDIILANLKPGDPFASTVRAIDRRNSRFAAARATREPTSRKQLIDLLDGSLQEPFSNDLPQRCWQIGQDKDILVSIVMSWASSAYRPGHTKIYAAARVLRAWSKLGADITKLVLDFVDTKTCGTGCCTVDLYHLISELARSEHFSTPEYLQWLIARGGIRNASELAVDGPCSSRLLAELPMHNTSESILELRSALLERADLSVEDEDDMIRNCMLLMNSCLPEMQASLDFEIGPSDAQSTLSKLPTGLSRTIVSELAVWLRQKVSLRMVQPAIPPLDDWNDAPVKRSTLAISATDFHTVREYLEALGDYSMLADILKMVTTSNDADVLASCADTLNLHLEAFAAIGALKGLFETLVARSRTLAEDINAVPRVFLVSLSSLACRIPTQKAVAHQLAQELARSDRKTAADACSPVSDHMALVETAEVDFTDEIEKVLASGNSMDKVTLERLFQRITVRLEGSWGTLPEQQRSCGLLLTRLRTFDTPQFDVLMAEWMSRALQMRGRPSLMEFLGPLISFGCVELRDVVASCGVTNEEDGIDSSALSNISLEVLEVLVASYDNPELMTHEEAYCFRIKQVHMQRDNPMEMLTAISRAFTVSFSSGSIDENTKAKALLETANMFQLYQKMVLHDPVRFSQKLISPVLQCCHPGAGEAINMIVDKLLLTTMPHHPVSSEELLKIVDDLSLPFCQVKLASMFHAQDISMVGEPCDSEHLASLDGAIEAAVSAGRTEWASIIPALNDGVAQHLRRQADAQFLSLFSSQKAAKSDDASLTNDHITRAENLFRIVSATAHSISTVPSDSTDVTLASDMVMALNGTWSLFANTEMEVNPDGTTCRWLSLLLSFMTIHVSAFEATKQGHECRSKAILGLAAILLLLQALEVNTPKITELVNQTFDLALHLVDCLPDDLRQQCIRSLGDTTSDPRICYLFSFAPNPTGWLMLSQKERIPSTSSTDGRSVEKEKLTPFTLRRWEMLGEPTPNMGENDTSLSLTLFGARRA